MRQSQTKMLFSDLGPATMLGGESLISCCSSLSRRFWAVLDMVWSSSSDFSGKYLQCKLLLYQTTECSFGTFRTFGLKGCSLAFRVMVEK